MTGFTWWVNGTMIPAADAVLPVTDHGFTVGDGCFETTPVLRGHAFAMTRHLARLRHSLAGLHIDLPVTDDEIRAAAAQVVARNPDAAIVRITVTAGSGPLGSGRGDGPPTLIVAAAAGRGWSSTAEIVTVPWTRNERGALAGIKSTSYAENVIALAHAKANGANEAIFPNTIGNLCEGTGTNIVVEHGGRLATPPLSSGCLAGVTRSLVLETSDVDEVDLPIDVLTTTTEAFLTSSTRNVMAITRIDNRVLDAGPLTATAADALAALMAGDVDP